MAWSENQVTPFTLPTPDGVTLYLWHILPLVAYTQNEATFSRESRVPLDKYTSSHAFRLLKDDPEARLILSCEFDIQPHPSDWYPSSSTTSFPQVHGNAGHIAQNTRAPQYRMLSNAHPNWHVIALDYRGFGHSTGSPTEEGLVADAAALVDFVLTTLQIPPSRILLLGQSLGTAVAAATAEKVSRERGLDLAGVVLVAPFSSLPTMLASYSLGGVVPLLRPLNAAPPLLRMVLGFVVDRWTSLDRLAALAAQTRDRGGRLRLSLVHGADDWDIPCVESGKIFEAAARASIKEGSGLDETWFLEMRDSVTDIRGDKAFKITWQGEADIVITHEQFPYGGKISMEFETQSCTEGETLTLTQATTISWFTRQFCNPSWLPGR